MTIGNIAGNQVINSYGYENVIFVASEEEVKIIDIEKNYVVSSIKSELTKNNNFYIYLVKDYLVIICYSRNSFEEYFLGDLTNPRLVKREFKLARYNYKI
jgi:hypothetical protein